MSRQVVLSLLRQGNTGNDLLRILDSLVNDESVNESPEPTLEEVEFWGQSPKCHKGTPKGPHHTLQFFQFKQPQPMNLYIINGVLNDWTSGMCVIAAESMPHCETIFMEEFAPSLFNKKERQNEFNEAEIKVIENVNHPVGVISYVYGGG